MVLRGILSFAILFAWGWYNLFLQVAAPLVVGPLAGQQFDNSQMSWVAPQFGYHLFSFIGVVSTFGVAAMLTALWLKPILYFIRENGGKFCLVLLALLLLPATAQAYYSKDNYAEPYYILPNQSAFWVPDTGANKDTQAQFGSEAYYAAHKIAAKLFVIPHVKLPDSGLWSNYYVPAGRLYIVDRSPFVREWTGAGRGTNHAIDEAFHCQTKEGLNITAEVTMAASVHDEDAAKFLFHFGVQAPSGNLTDPGVLFTSVLYSKSLTQVMDTVGKNAVGSFVCDEFSVRSFNQANADMAKEMQEIRQKVAALLGSWGITIDFMGWDGTFTFDDSVQKAIDNAYEAQTIQPMLPTLQAYADITVKQGLAKGLGDHGLPSNFLGIPLDTVGQMFGMSPPKH